MGAYLNCGNDGFRKIVNDIYVDKTGLIAYMNSTINTAHNMVCVSRPRRFGKSFAAKMLCAYYDKSCDSRELFEGLEIASAASFDQFLNQMDVIYLDITRFISVADAHEDIVSHIQKCVIGELREAYPGLIREDECFLADALFSVSEKTGSRFFFIIDEWDALFREAKTDHEVQKSYIRLLRGLFKGGPATDRTIAGAYLTGILPIKKYGTESALTDFIEYSMIEPAKLAQYVGFTEGEVQSLCDRYEMDFREMERWYDGYSLGKTEHVYNPNSVIRAIRNEAFGSYWTKSETYESLKSYIGMNMDGLKDAIIAMLGGTPVRVDTLSFQNDVTSFRNKDDVLTLLIHLGYLSYDEKRREVHIPNLEVADSFRLAVSGTDWAEVGIALREADALLEATICGKGEIVAEAFDRIHETSCSVLQYNNENSLSCALAIAYYTAKRDYMIVRELPTGKGFADLAFIPRKHTDLPAMIVELKYDRSADCAIAQMKEKRYGGELYDYAGELLLVGISYDTKTKKHSCVIERRA